MNGMRIFSSASGFFAERQTRFQLSDGPNTGATVPLSMLLVYLPDPDSDREGEGGTGVSEFITSNVGTNWNVQVFPVNGTVVGAALAITQSIPAATGGCYWIPLDPAVFTDEEYRVEIRDMAGNLAEQFDFGIFAHQPVAPGGTNTDINRRIRQLAGLLGYRQKITYADYLHGVPRTATIEMLDSTLTTTVQSWRRKITLDDAGRMIGETSMLLTEPVDLGVVFT